MAENKNRDYTIVKRFVNEIEIYDDEYVRDKYFILKNLETLYFVSKGVYICV